MKIKIYVNFYLPNKKNKTFIKNVFNNLSKIREVKSNMYKIYPKKKDK